MKSFSFKAVLMDIVLFAVVILLSVTFVVWNRSADMYAYGHDSYLKVMSNIALMVVTVTVLHFVLMGRHEEDKLKQCYIKILNKVCKLL